MPCAVRGCQRSRPPAVPIHVRGPRQPWYLLLLPVSFLPLQARTGRPPLLAALRLFHQLRARFRRPLLVWVEGQRVVQTA